MANDWDANPRVIDAAGNNGSLVENIKSFEWHPAAASDDLEIQDDAGNILWKIRASIGGSNHEDYAAQAKYLNRKGIRGVVIATIDGGTLYIHVL
jgi:hypothetical protein